MDICLFVGMIVMSRGGDMDDVGEEWMVNRVVQFFFYCNVCKEEAMFVFLGRIVDWWMEEIV